MNHDGGDAAPGWLVTGHDGGLRERGPDPVLCGLDSQKAKNLARDDRAEADKVLRMLPLKYPQALPLRMKMPTPDEVRRFRVTPSTISVLDYTKGFGHTDLVIC